VTGISVKPTMKRSLLVLFVGLGLVSGCAHRQGDGAAMAPPAAGQRVIVDEAKVLEIARQAVALNDTWVDRAEFERPKRQPDGSWSVLVWRLPKVPGGHRVIRIDENGRVTAYIRGA
jgi:hypothetical protein